MREKKKRQLTFETENLALPEIHTGVCEDGETDKKAEDGEKESIRYDNVAVPEIRTGRK